MHHHDIFLFFFFNDTATTEIYTLSLHDALPILFAMPAFARRKASSWRELIITSLATAPAEPDQIRPRRRSEEHTSELQSQSNLVCRLLLEKKKKLKTIDQSVSRTKNLSVRLIDI